MVLPANNTIIFVALFLFINQFNSALATTERPTFIVVGGGTAGCTIAARLCEKLPSAKVLLLERGAPRSFEAEEKIRQPRQAFNTWFDPTLSETFLSAPDPTINNRTLDILTGRSLGGSSSINSAQVTLPPKDVIPSWGFHNLTAARVKTLFKRIRKQTGLLVPPENLQHTYASEWLAAARRAGFDLASDPFSQERRDEVFVNRLTVSQRGRRVDACTAYLTPALNGVCRNRLELIQGATVTRILTKKSRDKYGNDRKPFATGVEYMTGGVLHTALARKEVILSAGPFWSPKLLQASGIGPRRVLEEAGVDNIVQDIPVGQYAQSRPVYFVSSVYTTRPLAPENNSTVLSASETIAQWRQGEGGPLGYGIAMVNGAVSGSAEILSTDALFGNALDVPIIGTSCVPNRNPNSFASIKITGRNVSAPLNVNLNFFSHPDDLRYTKECVQRMRQVHAELAATLGAVEVLPPGVTSSMLDDESFLEEYLRSSVTNAFHFVGGSAVGRVVDGHFRVQGVSKLRVVDASVVPQIPESAGIMTVVYVIAEHASDQLVEKYFNRFC